jgi:hypothetical protein
LKEGGDREMRKAVILLLPILLFCGCEDIFPEPEYTLTIVNESDYLIEVYLNDEHRGSVNSLTILRLLDQPAEIAGHPLNTMDIEGLSEGSYTLRVIYKNRIDPFSGEEMKLVKEIDVDSDLEITIEN